MVPGTDIRALDLDDQSGLADAYAVECKRPAGSTRLGAAWSAGANRVMAHRERVGAPSRRCISKAKP